MASSRIKSHWTLTSRNVCCELFWMESFSCLCMFTSRQFWLALIPAAKTLTVLITGGFSARSEVTSKTHRQLKVTAHLAAHPAWQLREKFHWKRPEQNTTLAQKSGLSGLPCDARTYQWCCQQGQFGLAKSCTTGCSRSVFLSTSLYVSSCLLQNQTHSQLQGVQFLPQGVDDKNNC